MITLFGCSQPEVKPPMPPTPFDRHILWEKCGDCDFLEDFGGIPKKREEIYYKFSHGYRCYGKQCEKLYPFGYHPKKQE